MSTVPGLDVSYWQADIDWSSVRSTDVRFVFIKATEGLAYTDSTFAQNWEGSRAQGLLRGAYCFFHPNQDARQQADRFVRAVLDSGDKGELPPSIDLEVTDGASNKKTIAGVKIWLDEVEQGLGRRPMIYSGVSFLESSFTEGGTPPPWAGDHALWLGWFPSKYVPGMKPLMPRGWPAWTFWQFSGKGRIRGIEAQVDLDLFNGSIEELTAFAGTKTMPATAGLHAVATGDTFESIASRYSVPIAQLVAANPQLLKVGESLAIPRQPSAPPEQPKSHIVAAGDTLYAIAKRYGTTIAALVARNRIPNPDVIQVGRVIVLA